MLRQLRSPVLVGRERELAELRRAVIGAHRGAGGLLLVTGEAGVGKSRLLAEGTGYATRLGMRMLTGRAVEGGGPFRPVAEALYGLLRDPAAADLAALGEFRPALSRLLAGPGPGDQPVSGVDPVVVLGEGVLRLLMAPGGGAGTAVVLEDLHWADRDTLALVEYLAPALPGTAVLVLAAARTDEEQPELLRRLAGTPGVAELPLARLTPDAVARLAAACTGGTPPAAEVVDFVVDAAEGLPFLVEELLAGLAEAGSLDSATVRGQVAGPVPRTLAELVRRRMARFTPPARQVVEAAAVVGRSVDWTLLGAVTGLPDVEVLAGLRAAVDGYLLEADTQAGGRFGWRHAMMREAVMAQLLEPERAALANRAAAAIEARDPALAGPDAVLAADLYARGGRADRAGELLVRLARRAVAGGALRSAEELLDRADGQGTGTAVAVERVRLLAFAGRGDEALAAGSAALSGAAGAERYALCLNLARAAVAAGHWAEADEYLDRTGRRGEPGVDAIAADAAFGAGRVAEAAALAEAAAGAAERAGLPEVACEALEVVARCAHLGDAGAAAVAFRRAADLAEEHGLVPWRIRALLGLGTTELDDDETDTLERVRELAVDVGMLARVADLDLLLGDATTSVAGPVAALPLLERSAVLARRVRLEQTAAMALAGCAEGYLLAGRIDDMRAALREAGERAAEGRVAADAAAAGTAVLAMATLLDRDLPGACRLYDAAATTAAGHGSAAPLRFLGLRVLVRTVLDDRAEAARDELRSVPAGRRAVNRGALLYADAVAAGRAGQPERAVALRDAGDEVLTRQHYWRLLLRLLVHEAALADGWGDAVDQLRQDLPGYDRHGAAPLSRTGRDLLRRAGAPVPRRGRGDSRVPAALLAVGVTSREMDVLGLVAQGLTNAQIAERLFLSPRTVETHVANLLAKTGAAGRAQLADHLDRRR